MLSRDAAYARFERAFSSYVERALADSPRARELCRALAGRTLLMVISGIDLQIQVVVGEQRLQLRRVTNGAADATAVDTAAADVTLRGTPLAFLAALGGNVEQLVAGRRLLMSGDEQLAPQFQELARLLHPGLEAGLAKFVGRVPAHLATRALAALQHWGRAAGRSLLDNSADYLAHESRDLVPRAEAEQFLSGVEALRQSVARAEARVAQLDQRLAHP